MRPTLPLVSLLSLTLSTLSLSFAAPLPLATSLPSLPSGEVFPRDLPTDPVAAALSSKLAAIDRELGRRPVLPTPAPAAGGEEDDGEDAGSTTTTSSAGRKKVGNPKKVKNPKARPATTTTAPAIIRRSPFPSPSPSPNPPPPPAPSNPKHPSSPAPPGNPKHIYSYPPSLPTGKWVVVRPSGSGEGGEGEGEGKGRTVTMVGVSPTHPGEPVGRGRETGRV